MSGETEAQVSAWTPDTVHVHVLDLITEADRRNNERFVAVRDELHTTSNAAKEAVTAALIAQKEAVAAALMAAEKAVLVAEANSQLWRASANEWRGSMDDRERNFARNDFVDTRFAALTDKIDAGLATINEKVGDLTGRVDRSEPLHVLQSRMDTRDGRTTGTDKLAATLLSAAAVAIALIAVIVTVVLALTR